MSSQNIVGILIWEDRGHYNTGGMLVTAAIDIPVVNKLFVNIFIKTSESGPGINILPRCPLSMIF